MSTYHDLQGILDFALTHGDAIGCSVFALISWSYHFTVSIGFTVDGMITFLTYPVFYTFLSNLLILF